MLLSYLKAVFLIDRVRPARILSAVYFVIKLGFRVQLGSADIIILHWYTS